ncbi:MAG: DUF4367 domain-containing protein [Dethiobacter sp.]|jgi:hypothetical protein|nr:DUF4367 domain-containing protein [Dethiobacter sp.]MBS3989533.1 DUF4367 domain-containing protein [Dethiobacter sp.]
MSYSFTEDTLKSAVIKADRYLMEALPADNEIDHVFSRDFEKKMQKLIRRSKKDNTIRGQAFWRRRAVALIATIIILIASAMSVPAVRASVIEFITEVYEKFTHIFFDESRSPRDAADELTIYEPSLIPEGFKMVNKKAAGLVLMEYERENDFISYSQQRLENVSMHINTEGVELEELEFKGFSAKYYSNRGVQNLLWHDDEYMYMVSSTLDRNTVFKIADSVEPVGGR